MTIQNTIDLLKKYARLKSSVKFDKVLPDLLEDLVDLAEEGNEGGASNNNDVSISNITIADDYDTENVYALGTSSRIINIFSESSEVNFYLSEGEYNGQRVMIVIEEDSNPIIIAHQNYYYFTHITSTFIWPNDIVLKPWDWIELEWSRDEEEWLVIDANIDEGYYPRTTKDGIVHEVIKFDPDQIYKLVDVHNNRAPLFRSIDVVFAYNEGSDVDASLQVPSVYVPGVRLKISLDRTENSGDNVTIVGNFVDTEDQAYQNPVLSGESAWIFAEYKLSTERWVVLDYGPGATLNLDIG